VPDANSWKGRITPSPRKQFRPDAGHRANGAKCSSGTGPRLGETRRITNAPEAQPKGLTTMTKKNLISPTDQEKFHAALAAHAKELKRKLLEQSTKSDGKKGAK
jgi:hypothetical protein